MTEWGVVGVLAALAGLAATLVTPMLKLNTTMTRLVVLVEELSDKLAAMEQEAAAVRGEVHAHETRITVLERNGGRHGEL